MFLHFLQENMSVIHFWIFSHYQNVIPALCFDKTECSWLLQYVWVDKEPTLIISPAQRGSDRARLHKKMFAVCKAFTASDN